MVLFVLILSLALAIFYQDTDLGWHPPGTRI